MLTSLLPIVIHLESSNENDEVEHEYSAARNSGSHQSNGSQKLGAGGAIERKKFPEEPGDLQNAYKVSINHFFIPVFFNHFRFT